MTEAHEILHLAEYSSKWICCNTVEPRRGFNPDPMKCYEFMNILILFNLFTASMHTTMAPQSPSVSLSP